ncbi:MAG: ribonuclease J [Bacilli bacterium]|nr:ribonuclease J [Bacilli bacterium]
MEKSISMPVSIYALGGLGEVGKNMYCIENDKSIIIIDAGVKFPGIEFPGINYIVPDFTHLKNNRNKIKALFITHGHEDHIGGIPFLLQNIHVPVIYAPRLAAALIKNRLEEYRMADHATIKEYDSDTKVKVDLFTVSFFRVTHSIPDSFGIVVDTPEGRIVSSGDFKIDLTPIGKDIELTRMAEIGKEGVDLLLSESTNAEQEGYTPSEKNVYDSIDEIIKNANGRLIVSTFASNISRIQQVLESAVSHNRKIAIIGRSMEKAVDISRSFGYIHVPDNSIIETEDVKRFPNNEILILCTGSQGESMAALSRIANGSHKDIHIIPGDTIVFSSSAIPGNGIMIDNIINQLARSGAEVITNSILNDIHSSGHASRQELRFMLKLMKPKFFMPIHGEYRMLRLHAEMAEDLGVKKENIFILDNGDSLVLSKGKVKRGYPVEHGVTYIDGKDINSLAEPVINDRRVLMDDGMFAITVSIDSKRNILLTRPSFYVRGFIDQGNKQASEELKTLLEDKIKEKLYSKPSFAELKLLIKEVAGLYVYRRTKRAPIIIPVILSKN